MTEPTPIATFTDAGIEWASGGRGQHLVNAAVAALAEGVDSPSLRVLAGAPGAFADEEAAELAPDVFAELGITIEERFSSAAIVRGARLAAARFLAASDRDPRSFARNLYRMGIDAGYPTVLNFWMNSDDDYSLVDEGIYSMSQESMDRAVIEAAKALVDSTPNSEL